MSESPQAEKSRVSIIKDAQAEYSISQGYSKLFELEEDDLLQERISLTTEALNSSTTDVRHKHAQSLCAEVAEYIDSLTHKIEALEAASIEKSQRSEVAQQSWASLQRDIKFGKCSDTEGAEAGLIGLESEVAHLEESIRDINNERTLCQFKKSEYERFAQAAANICDLLRQQVACLGAIALAAQSFADLRAQSSAQLLQPLPTFSDSKSSVAFDAPKAKVVDIMPDIDSTNVPRNTREVVYVPNLTPRPHERQPKPKQSLAELLRDIKRKPLKIPSDIAPQLGSMSQ